MDNTVREIFQNTGVGNSSLLQGIFPIQGSNLGLEHCRMILHQLSHQESPRLGAATAAKLLQSCPTLCDPTDGSPPGSPVPEILQARTLAWFAISFSKNREVSSISLLQCIFLTQESNRSLLHCRRILYQLSYQGNLLLCKWTLNLTSKLSQILLSYFL